MALWTPSQITTALWLDASDTATLFDATTGGNLVTTHNAQVKRWQDKSGNARHATQDNAAGPKAQLTSNLLNGLPVLRFADALNSWLNVAASSVFTPSLLTIVAVMRTSSTNDNRGIAGRWSTTNGLFWALLHRNFTGSFTPSVIVRNSANTASIAATGTTQLNNGSGRLFGCTFQSGGSLRLFVDSVNEATATQTSERTGTSAMTIGSYSDGVNTGLTGDLAELVFINSASVSERQLIEGYAAWKWGIQATLPNDHPYKNAAPTAGGNAGAVHFFTFGI